MNRINEEEAVLRSLQDKVRARNDQDKKRDY